MGTAEDLGQGIDAMEQLRQSQTLMAALPPGSDEEGRCAEGLCSPMELYSLAR